MSPTCDGCDAIVSHDYHRVFSTNDGELPVCPACAANAQHHNPAEPLSQIS